MKDDTQKIIKVFDENFSNGRVYIDKENLLLENQTLKEQNASLQSKLDKTIKQLKDYEKALKDYAECEPIEIKREYWNGEKSSINCTMADIGVSARKILKKWENK